MMATITLPPVSAQKQSSAYLIGSLLGAFLLTGLLSRVIWRRYERTVKGALLAFGVVGALCMAIGSLTMGPKTAILYVATAGVWLVLDLVRSQPAD